VPLNYVFVGLDLTLPPTPPANPVYALALPALVLVTTWLQSKMMTPATPPSQEGQPNQAAAMTQSMTTIMPIMMGFFSLSFSVGLSIYFVVSNIFSIVQYALQGQGDWRSMFRFGKPAEAAATNTVVGSAKPKKAEDDGLMKADGQPDKKSVKTPQSKSKTQKAKPAK
jgi:YidC/Oxa1 family membrane protein insertase